MRQWIEANCWNCSAPNLIDNGDISDLTIGDIEGFKCYHCKTNNVFDDEGNCIETDEDQDQLDDGYAVPKS